MISKRLKQIADLVDTNKVVFDVGSDHALLPCFLVQEGIINKAYAGDIALGPLDNAKSTIEKLGLTGKVIPVFSDGLKMANKDVDVVTISGMGYQTVEHILNDSDISKYQYIIVQINKDVNLLRQYISDHNYTIEDERVVYDSFYYEIVKFSCDLHDSYTEKEINYGPILLKRKDEEFINYLNFKKNRLIEINEKANKPEFTKTILEIEEILKWYNCINWEKAYDKPI